jgi:ABC-type transport system involved in multi-copper enzyme maturation permease subunit
MKNLLLSDFRRVLKDKMMLVILIIAVAFSFFTPILYAVIFSFGVEGLDDPAISMLINAKSQFFQCFSMGNNLGLIMPVLLGIIICKDFSHGTIRNKIISGASRSKIYASMFIVCATVITAVMLLNAFLSLGVSLVFFEYQPEPFELADFGYFVASLGMVLLLTLFMGALLSWLCACSKNVGLVIVLYIAIAFALVMAGSITQLAATFLGMQNDTKAVADIFDLLTNINPAMLSSRVGIGREYTFADVMYNTLPQIICGTGLYLIGLMKFRKRDIK